jgi:hypothetical protein
MLGFLLVMGSLLSAPTNEDQPKIPTKEEFPRTINLPTFVQGGKENSSLFAGAPRVDLARPSPSPSPSLIYKFVGRKVATSAPEYAFKGT